MAPTRRLTEDEERARSKTTDATGGLDIEKDDNERRLESILFGDEAGFLDAIKQPYGVKDGSLTRMYAGPDDLSLASAEDENMEDVADEDLFFLDDSAGTLPIGVAADLPDSEPQPGFDSAVAPIWVDSDDERLTISLASNTRLRKLRNSQEDDAISGTEYIQRLRRQYEQLHPVPEWVRYARKKTRLSAARSDASSDSDFDISLDEHALLTSTQSIADLLSSTDSLTKQSSSIDSSKRRKLRPDVIDIQRLPDIAGHGPSSIDVLQFHPKYPLLLSAGPSSTINLYHVSPHPPNPNPIVTSLHLKNTPFYHAEFCQAKGNSQEQASDDQRIFVSSRRRYLHAWSLSKGTVSKISRPVYSDLRHEQKTMENFKLSPCGLYMGLVGSAKKGGGTINVLSTDTMQWLCSCRIDSQGGIADFAWWQDSAGFVVVGKNGEASEYSIKQRRVLKRWIDQGAVGVTVIALGGHSGRSGHGGNRWVAVGSSSGIVNIYDRKEWSDDLHSTAVVASTRPEPTKVLDQLTTPTSHLLFSQDGQMLAMGSRWKKNALRLVHLPSCTIYKNWPTDRTPLGRVSSIAISMDGTHLAVANEQGKIRLWQIRE